MTAKQVPPTLSIVPGTTVPDPFDVKPSSASPSHAAAPAPPTPPPSTNSTTSATSTTSPPSTTSATPMVGGALDVVPTDQFEALMRRGRARGGLTQDDVVTVLRTVELNEDLITEVVRRIRAAGIEFTYDTGETTVVPVVGTLGDGSAPLADVLEGTPPAPDTTGPPPARIVALEAGRGTPRTSGTALEGPDLKEAAPARPSVRRERAPRRSAGQRRLCRKRRVQGLGRRPGAHVPEGDRQGQAARRLARGGTGRTDPGRQRGGRSGWPPTTGPTVGPTRTGPPIGFWSGAVKRPRRH